MLPSININRARLPRKGKFIIIAKQIWVVPNTVIFLAIIDLKLKWEIGTGNLSLWSCPSTEAPYKKLNNRLRQQERGLCRGERFGAEPE